MLFGLLAIRALTLLETVASITTILAAIKLGAETYEKVEGIVKKKKEEKV